MKERRRTSGTSIDAHAHIAVVQAVQLRQWAVATVLSAVAIFAVACSLMDAAVSRRSEFAADRFATERGVGMLVG